jgi:hypothetical protein
VEAAAAHRDALRDGDKKEGLLSWLQVKFDRQIVAIAKIEAADAIYSNDRDIERLSARDGITVIQLDQLPTPQDNPQGRLSLGSEDEQST